VNHNWSCRKLFVIPPTHNLANLQRRTERKLPDIVPSVPSSTPPERINHTFLFPHHSRPRHVSTLTDRLTTTSSSAGLRHGVVLVGEGSRPGAYCAPTRPMEKMSYPQLEPTGAGSLSHPCHSGRRSLRSQSNQRPFVLVGRSGEVGQRTLSLCSPLLAGEILEVRSLSRICGLISAASKVSGLSIHV
jgi:hypothetical protein